MSFHTFLPRLLNMSLTASIVILFVLLLRLCLKRAPKVISYALWGIVLFRLLCPVSISSDLSLFGLMNPPVTENGSMEYIPVQAEPMPQSVTVVDTLPQTEATSSPDPMAIAAYVWMAGAFAMFGYALSSYIRLRRKLLIASPLRDNIYLADEIATPFVMGLLRPKIYLPSAMDEKEQSYVLLHEQHHIRRLDHVFKALAFAALCIYWFNPLVWLAFITAGKDMEMSCDEAVVKKMGTEILADYTASLLSLATGKRIIAGMPLAFGEGDAKGRIRNLANWKKPAFWVILLSALVGIAVAVCFLTNPKQDSVRVQIRIPAGSQEAVVYSDEEISPHGSYILVTPEDDLTSAEVYIKPIEVKTETAYDEPTPLTPGKASRIRLEKGGWFKIGVNLQNDTDEDMVVYLDVKNIALRISGDAEPAMQTFAAELLEIHENAFLVKPLEGSSTERFEIPMMNMRPSPEPQIGDILEITYRGLLTNVERIRVLEEKQNATPSLAEAIHNAILANNQSAASADLYHCASFIQLEQEEIAFDSDPPTPSQITVYGLALYQAFAYTYNDNIAAIQEKEGSHIPVAITFEETDDGYSLLEYWTPGDGSDYAPDIRNKFPDSAADEAMDTQKYILAQKQNCYAQAVAHGNLDTDPIIDQLFEVLASSPATASSTADYISAHPIEYRELTYYGNDTLQYIFAQFLQGGQTGLHGQLMNDMFHTLAPQEQRFIEAEDAQAYFDEWKASAIQIGRQHDMDWIRENQPVIALFLEML